MRTSSVLAALFAVGFASHANAGRWVTCTVDPDPYRVLVDEVDPAARVRSNLVTATPTERSAQTAVVTANRRGQLYSVDGEHVSGSPELRRMLLATWDLASGSVTRTPLDLPPSAVIYGLQHDSGEDRLFALVAFDDSGVFDFGLLEIDPDSGVTTELSARFSELVQPDLVAMDEEGNRFFAIAMSTSMPTTVSLLTFDTVSGARLPDVPLPLEGVGCLGWDYRHVEWDPVLRRLLGVTWPCVGPTRLVAINPLTGSVRPLADLPLEVGTGVPIALDPCGRRIGFLLSHSLIIYDADTGAGLASMRLDEEEIWVEWDRDMSPCGPYFRAPQLGVSPMVTPRGLPARPGVRRD